MRHREDIEAGKDRGRETSSAFGRIAALPLSSTWSHFGGAIMSDEQQIRDLVSAWMNATRSGDGATVLSLMTDDALFLLPGQAPMTKKDFAAQAEQQSSNEGPLIDGTSNIKEINVSGDMASMVSELNVSVTTPDGEQLSRSGHTLTVFRKIEGRWYLSRDANLLTPDD